MTPGREAVLIAARDLSASVRWLRFRCLDGAPLPFVAGQWVNLWVDADGVPHKRAYSLSGLSPADAPDTFEVAVTRVEGGAVSCALHTLAPGGRCRVDGPYGMFTRAGLLDQPAVFVGTGTGLCPLRAMLQEALTRPVGPALTLLFGCRTQRDILFGEELHAVAAARPELSVHVTLSRPEPGWSGMTGYVQTHLSEVIGEGTHPHVFVCGLSPMIKAVRAALKGDLGYDRKHIHSERFD